MSEWRECKISDLVDIDIATYSLKENWPFVNYLDTGSVTENNIEQIQYLDPAVEKIPSRARRKVKVGSIVYSTVRPNQRHYALIKEVPENFLVSTGFAVLDVKPNVADARFVFSYLTQADVVNALQSIAEQGVCTYPALNPSDIGDLTLKVPDLPTQRKIAAVLGALDDKIELNRKMNANLEAMAQALFKSWFVDFEPFGGQMPEGWKMGRLEEIAKITMGQSPDGSTLNEEKNGIVFYQGRAEFGSRFPTVRLYTTAPNRMAYVGDILLSVRAPVGDLNIAYEDCCIGRGLSAIKSTANCQSYLYYLLKTKSSDFAVYDGAGTVFGSINKQALHALEVLIPTQDLMEEFESLCCEFDSRIKVNDQQIRTLAQLRDTLLPKLMSGELNVDDVKID